MKQHCNITIQHNKTQNNILIYKQYYSITKQHNKT